MSDSNSKEFIDIYLKLINKIIKFSPDKENKMNILTMKINTESVNIYQLGKQFQLAINKSPECQKTFLARKEKMFSKKGKKESVKVDIIPDMNLRKYLLTLAPENRFTIWRYLHTLYATLETANTTKEAYLEKIYAAMEEKYQAPASVPTASGGSAKNLVSNLMNDFKNMASPGGGFNPAEMAKLAQQMQGKYGKQLQQHQFTDIVNTLLSEAAKEEENLTDAQKEESAEKRKDIAKMTNLFESIQSEVGKEKPDKERIVAQIKMVITEISMEPEAKKSLLNLLEKITSGKLTEEEMQAEIAGILPSILSGGLMNNAEKMKENKDLNDMTSMLENMGNTDGSMNPEDIEKLNEWIAQQNAEVDKELAEKNSKN